MLISLYKLYFSLKIVPKLVINFFKGLMKI